MHDLPSSKKYGCFDFISLFQESDNVILLELVIVIIRVRPELHFLDRNVLLVLLGFVKFLVQLVEVLSIVHDPANRGSCSRRHLYQVQASLFGHLYGLLRRHDSELVVVVVYDANLPSPDAMVHPYVFVDGQDLLKIFPFRETLTITKKNTYFQRA